MATSEATPPTVSTGTDADRDFAAKVAKDPINLRKLGITTVIITWRGKKRSFDMNPDFVLSYTDRVEGILREAGAAYLVWRDGNRCTIQSSYCTQGNRPFARPAGADFDHINGDKHEHRCKNVRLACHACNAHQQELQRKQILAAASPHLVERGSEGARPSSAEMERSLPMRARWLLWIKGKLQGVPDILKWDGKEIRAKDLCEKAPRACARTELGEETLGVAKTYEQYVPMDSSDKGGPLVIRLKTSEKTGRVETWVRRTESS